MLWSSWAVVLLSMLGCMVGVQTLKASSSGYKLQHQPTYLVVAPRTVRPDQTVQVHVSVFHPGVTHVRVSASIRKQDQEYAATSQTFSAGSSDMLQLKMPDYATAGNYSLRVEGATENSIFGNLFENETEILFQPKRVSVFIQTDKPMYQKKETVRFRVIAITPRQMPVETGSISIYCRDGKGHIIRRWLSKQLYNGVYENSFVTADPLISNAMWSLQVVGWGYTYDPVYFKMESNYWERFEINVTLPAVVTQHEFALAGLIKSNHTQSGLPVRASGHIELEIRPPGAENNYSYLYQNITFHGGVSSFLFPMADIRGLTPKMVGTELLVTVTLTDFYSLDTISATARSVIHQNNIFIKYLGGNVRTFKPGYPFNVIIAAYHSDGSPLKMHHRRQVYISTTLTSRYGGTRTTSNLPHIIADDSVIRYNIIPDDDTEFFRVRASYGSESKPQLIELTAYRQYSHTNHHIAVTTKTWDITVDRYLVFTVKTTIYVPELFYLVVSGGNIVVGNKIFMNSRQKTVALAVSRDMVPSARLVVYCVLGDGEVLADSISFYVRGIRSDGVAVQINKGKDFSGDTAELTAVTDPGSFIGYSVADYELWARGGATFLTLDKVEDELNSYDAAANLSWRHTWLLDETRKKNVHFAAPSYAIDANTTFLFAGLTVLTDAELTRKPAMLLCNVTQGYKPCFDGSCYLTSQRCDNIRQCQDGADEMGCAELTPPGSRPDELKHLHRKWYHLDKVDWGWNSFYTKPDGRLDFKAAVPLRPATWVVGVFSLNREKGLAFNDEPARFDSTRPIYMTVEMPKSCKRGEQIGVQVAVFNYWSQPTEVLLTLEGSANYRFINVETGGWVSSYQPRTSAGDMQTLLSLGSGEKRFIHFPVVPVKLGKLKVIIHALSFIRRQTIKKSLTVHYEGITNTYHTPYFLNLVSHGSIIIPDFEIPVPDFFIHPEQRWHSYVPGSPVSIVSVVGDIMGPGFLTNHLEIMNLFEFHEGQGDHYIFNLGMNIYWLKFLKNTNQLDEATLNSVLTQCVKDLQRMVAFQRPDGGYAIRRKRTPSTLWLTSYALHILAEASEAEWEENFYIDVDILNNLATFILKHQHPSTGGFRNNEGPVYFINFMDNHTSSDGQPLNISITAYVTVGLAKAVAKLSGDVQSHAEAAKDLAADYLASHFHLLQDPFEVCLVTYALHVTNHKMKGVAFKHMRKLKHDGELPYWSMEEIPPIPVEVVNTVPFLQPHPMPRALQGRAIQATAWALMVYLYNNWFTEAEPIMEWLQTQRHSHSGFLGTQDTITATQALKEYGERITNRDLYNMLVRLESTYSSQWKPKVSLSKGNFLHYNSYKVPTALNTIRSSAMGTGLALLQLSTKVNVEHPWLLRRTSERSFDLEVDQLIFTGRNSSNMHMKVCASWARPDLSPVSGAVIIDVEIPTGFVVYKSVLRKFSKEGSIRIQRTRFTKQKVVWYFDYIDTNRNCWEFTGIRMWPVANGTIQHRVRIFDTFEYGLQNVTMYMTYNLFHLHICQVCGSFQCPYCPFYNTAYHVTPVTSLIICICTLVGLLLFNEVHTYDWYLSVEYF